MRFLVDTNVISEVRHPKGSRVVKRRFRELDTETVFTSVVVFGELTKGVRSLPKGRRKTGLEVWLGQFESGFGDRILPIDPQVAKVWGELMSDGLAKGVQIGVSDGQIAATAIVHHLTIITRNKRHFEPTGARVWNIWASGYS